MHQADELDAEAYNDLVSQLAVGQAALRPAEARPEQRPAAILPASLAEEIAKANLKLKQVEAGSSAQTRIVTPESALLAAIKQPAKQLKAVTTKVAPSFVELGRAISRRSSLKPASVKDEVEAQPLALQHEESDLPPPPPPEAFARPEDMLSTVVRGDRAPSASSIADETEDAEGVDIDDVAARMNKFQAALAKDADAVTAGKKYAARAKRDETLQVDGVKSAGARAQDYQRSLESDMAAKKKTDAQRKKDALAAAAADKVERRLKYLGKAGISDEKIGKQEQVSNSLGVRGLGLQLKATNRDAKQNFEKRKLKMEAEIAREGVSRAKRASFEARVTALSRALGGAREEERQFEEKKVEMTARLKGEHEGDLVLEEKSAARRKAERVKEARAGKTAGGFHGMLAAFEAVEGKGKDEEEAQEVYPPLHNWLVDSELEECEATLRENGVVTLPDLLEIPLEGLEIFEFEEAVVARLWAAACLLPRPKARMMASRGGLSFAADDEPPPPPLPVVPNLPAQPSGADHRPHGLLSGLSSMFTPRQARPSQSHGALAAGALPSEDGSTATGSEAEHSPPGSMHGWLGKGAKMSERWDFLKPSHGLAERSPGRQASYSVDGAESGKSRFGGGITDLVRRVAGHERGRSASMSVGGPSRLSHGLVPPERVSTVHEGASSKGEATPRSEPEAASSMRTSTLGESSGEAAVPPMEPSHSWGKAASKARVEPPEWLVPLSAFLADLGQARHARTALGAIPSARARRTSTSSP